MRYLILILSITTTLNCVGQVRHFNTRDFGGTIGVSHSGDSTVLYTLTLTNKSLGTIYLLKTWTSFDSVQTDNPSTVYFDLTFPISGDIYQCKSCDFRLHKVIPDDSITLKVVKTAFQSVTDVIVTFDPIKLENVKDKRLRKQLETSGRQNDPRISFKYYFDSGGQPLNPETVTLKM